MRAHGHNYWLPLPRTVSEVQFARGALPAAECMRPPSPPGQSRASGLRKRVPDSICSVRPRFAVWLVWLSSMYLSGTPFAVVSDEASEPSRPGDSQRPLLATTTVAKRRALCRMPRGEFPSTQRRAASRFRSCHHHRHLLFHSSDAQTSPRCASAVVRPLPPLLHHPGDHPLIARPADPPLHPA